MVRLSVLGTLDLKAPDDRVLSSILAQPKRTALLAFLALARPRGLQRRDVLLALFWPELPEDRARANLSNALYFLRRSLPAGTLAARGDGEIGIEDGRVWCDALALETALEEGRAEDALALYAGDLLPGFHLDDAPEWERWLDDERARLRRTMSAAACGLADRAAADGDSAAAAGWARRALELDPADELALRRLVGLLDGMGDRVGALREYDAFAARLEAELGLEPSPETRALADAVRQREEARAAPAAADGVPVPVAVSATEAQTAPAEAEVPSAAAPPPVPVPATRKPVHPQPPPTTAGRRWPRKRWAGLAIIAALVLPVSSATYTVWQRAPAHRSAPEPGRVAVLPFAVRANPGLEHMGAGVADLLSARLDGRDSLRTVDPTALFHAVGATGTLPGDLERSGAVSTRFGAGQYITGSVVQAGSNIEITASVYRADGRPRARRTRTAASERDVLPALDSLVESLLKSELTDLTDGLRSLSILKKHPPCVTAPPADAEPDLLGALVAVQQGAPMYGRAAHPPAGAVGSAAASAGRMISERDSPGTAAGCPKETA
jgi:DNA-binding SARP family transcriptional activator